MQPTNRDYVARSLEIAAAGLEPFVESVLSPLLPAGTPWTELLRQRDRANGKPGAGVYASNDLYYLLFAMTRELGTLRYPFNGVLDKMASHQAKELSEVRNSWAHGGQFTFAQTMRVIDTVEVLLAAVNATEQSDAARTLKSQFQSSKTPDAAPGTVTVEAPASSLENIAEQPARAANAVSIEIDAVPVLSYAAAHNRLPVVNSITISNPGEALREVVVRIEVRSALGVMSLPFEQLVDLAAHDSKTLTEVALVLDPAAMLQVEERRPASIYVTAQHNAEQLGEQHTEVDLLAAHQWVRRPENLALELLAAYVQPNHPAITALLSEASDWLENETGSGALEGYTNEDESRVDKIAEAIFVVMQRRGIRYALPPASWGDDGQKVRTPSEVLEGRVGTCLDTTVVMAAALEQAGLHPLLWIVAGHAFVGYWREDASFNEVATSEPAVAINLVDLGKIAVVETTLVTGSAASFADARRLPEVNNLRDNPGDILGITDVRTARFSKISPLPARVANADGTVTVTEYVPAASIDREYEEYERASAAAPDRAVVPYRVAQWKNSLLDLSLRNRLINFTDSARLTLSVADSDVAHLEDLINDGKAVSLLPSDDLPAVQKQRGVRYGRDLPEADRTAQLRDKREVYSDITEAAYTAKLRALAYKAKTIEEETGANNLYLAFGSLVWNFNGRELRSPLVLVPVKIETGRGGKYRIVHDESGTSTPNYCLLEKLKQSNSLSIPGLADPVEDTSGIDLAAAFQATRIALVEAGLPFRVESTVDLSILQFAKFRLWKDLDENWEELAKNPLVRHLIESPTAEFVDPQAADLTVDLDELGALSPIPADSSQLGAIAAAVGGQTFVLEGPPGTGKSQTITNLLVRSIADGKKVLFVAEKRAALQVVQRRLDEVGLGAFTLDLHDKGSRPLAVRAQIKDALQHRVTADRDGIRAARDTLDGSRRGLARYASRLHEANAAGLSLYSSRARLLAADPFTPTMQVPQSLVTSSIELSESVRSLLRRLPDVADAARPAANHPWALVDSAAGINQQRLLEALATLDDAVDALPTTGALAAAINRVVDTAALPALAGVAAAPAYPLATVDASRADAWKAAVAAALGELDALLASKVPGVNPTIVAIDLPSVHTAATAADESSFFGRKKRRLAARALVASYIDESALPKPADVSALTLQLAQLQQRVNHVRATFAAVPGLAQSNDWNPLVETDSARLRAVSDWISWLGIAVPPATAADPSVRDYYAQRPTAEPLANSLVTAAAEAFAAAQVALAANSITSWADGQPIVPLWRATAPSRAVTGAGRGALERWIDLISYVEPLLAHGLDDARRDILTGTLAPEMASASFEKGLAATSIDERAATTTLDSFDAHAHNASIDRFTDSSQRTRELLVTDIPADLLQRRTFDVGGTGGQIGELKRQLDRQRGGLGVRALLARFGPLISELTPCVLMSPESVARFFEAQSNLFDVIVFDEASQIRVADAIGAMGRGRSVVVVGDSKQMPPTSFAEATIAVDEESERSEETFVQDEESILSECVSAQVPSRALTWHYRSQDEALISFSNEHYYGNLSSFPSPLHGSVDAGARGHGISLVRVAGTFLRSGAGKSLRTNPVEAAAIVAEIRERFVLSPVVFPSLGVVTFNAQQRALIESLLRDAGDPRIIEALDNTAEGLFVKNLENVQGDERDTILFSTAFSVNDKGVLPLNFGPVGQAGGERRLNVAITRARRQVIMFSSFDPSELRAEDSTSVGLKHLKLYLELAASEHQTTAAKFGDNTVDRHREQIATELRERGLVVSTDVGLSDFRIDLSIASADEPTQPLLAVLLDNEAWAKRKTVADRDGLPHSVLSQLMKWPAVSRVWLPDWMDHSDSVLDRLVAETTAAAEIHELSELTVDLNGGAHGAPAAVEVGVVSAAPTLAPLPLHARPGAVVSDAGGVNVTPPRPDTDEVFVPWQFRRAGDVSTLDRLPARDAQAEVSRVIVDIVEQEGPIHVVRLAKLAASSFDLNRVVQARVQSILKCISSELKVAGDTLYLWPAATDVTQWKRYRRTPGGVERDIEHVHPLEIGNAMVAIAIKSAGLYEDELRRSTINFFGLSKLTPRITMAVDAALARAFDTGMLVRTASGVIEAA